MVLVSCTDQESREPKLSHRANRDEDEEEWVVMGPDVRHSLKLESSGRIGTSASQWLREDRAKVWTRAIEGLVHRGMVVMPMRKTRGSRPKTGVRYTCAPWTKTMWVGPLSHSRRV